MSVSYLSAQKKHRKKRVIIALGLLCAIIIYSIVWLFIAGKIERKARQELEEVMLRQPATRCEDLHVSGYPLRFDIICESISISRPSDAVKITAGRLISGFPVYAPLNLSHYLTGPALVEWPGLNPLELNWSNLQTNTRLTRPIPEKISLKGQDISLSLRKEPTYSEPFANLADLSLAFSLQGNEVNATGRFAGLTFVQTTMNSQNIPEIDGLTDIVIHDAVSLMNDNKEPTLEKLRGHSGEIRQFMISTNNGAMISISGPLSLDEEGNLSGKLSVELIEPISLAQTAQNYLPEQSSNISTLLFALTAIAGEKSGNLTLTIDIDKGKMRAGFIPLGRLPAL